MSQEEIENLNRPITSTEIETVIRNLPGAVLRWWRNRMGIPLSPSQIPHKNISTLSNLHKTTSECWQRTSGIQKSRSLSSKSCRKNIKDKKRDKEGGRELRPGKGSPSQEGNFRKRGFQTPGNTPCQVCGKPWKHKGEHNRKEK